MQADRISEGVREDVQKSAVSALVKEHTSKEHQGLVVSEVASACASPFRITKARCCTSLRERAPTALVTLFCWTVQQPPITSNHLKGGNYKSIKPLYGKYDLVLRTNQVVDTTTQQYVLVDLEAIYVLTQDRKQQPIITSLTLPHWFSTGARTAPEVSSC